MKPYGVSGSCKKEYEQSRLYYQTESEAFIALPIRPMNEAVTVLHLVTAVKEVGNFGLMDERNFEMLLVRIAGETVPALAK
jgi:hypothetical protein